jgi:type I restriction enzyme S subunit
MQSSPEQQQTKSVNGCWKTAPLEDCMEAIIDYRGKTPEKKTFGVPLITAKVIKGGRIEPTEEFIAESDYESWMRRGMPKRGDVVMTTEAPLGEIAQLDGSKIALAQRVITLRGKPELLDNTFLKFLMQSDEVQEELRSRATGTTVLGIRQSELRQVSLTLPPLAEQKRIAEVLGVLDEKIELNRRMNAALEATARALFQSWFVDFDPVRAKLDGRTPSVIDPATAALFPDCFEESPLGRIPKGWEVKTAEEISAVGIGKTPPRKEHHWFSENPADIPWMSIRDLGEAGVFISKTSEFLTSEAVEKFRVRRIPNDTVVLSFKLTMGRVSITDGEMLSNEAIAHFRLNPETPFGSAYLYCYLKGFGFDQLGSTSSIATAINSDMVRGIKILVPSKEVAEAFERMIAPLFAQMKSIQKQSQTLATLRDTLLPKLLRGELSVREAQRDGAEHVLST